VTLVNRYSGRWGGEFAYGVGRILAYISAYGRGENFSVKKFFDESIERQFIVLMYI